MRKAVLPVLVLLNLAALGVLIALNTPTGHGIPESVSVDELRYGAVDVDGDGECGVADDIVLDWLLRNAYHHVEEAGKTAKRNPDGTIDLSPYLRKFRAAPPPGSAESEANPRETASQ